jgi:hypothetical protein
MVSTSRSRLRPSGRGRFRRSAQAWRAITTSSGSTGSRSSLAFAIAAGRPASRTATTSSGRLTAASSCKDSLQAIARRVAISSGDPRVGGAVRTGMGTVSGLGIMVMAGPLAKHPAAPSCRCVGNVLAAGAGGMDEFLGDHRQPVAQVGAMPGGIGKIVRGRKPVGWQEWKDRSGFTHRSSFTGPFPLPRRVHAERE